MSEWWQTLNDSPTSRDKLRILNAYLRSSEIDLDFPFEKYFPDRLEYIWSGISRNSHLTWNQIMDNLDQYPWDYTGLMSRADAELEFFLKNKDLIEIWNWRDLSAMLPFQIIKDNLDLPWSIFEIGDQSDLDWDFIIQHADWDWDWDLLSRRVPIHVVQDHLDLSWDFSRVQNPIPELVLARPELDWNLTKLNPIDFHRIKAQLPSGYRVKFPKLHWDDVEDIVWKIDPENPSLNEKIEQLYQQHGIPWDLVAAYPEAGWELTHLAEYVDSLEIIDSIPGFDHPGMWDLFSLYLPLDLIIENMDRPWFFNTVSDRDDFDQFDPELILEYPRAGWNLISVKETFPEIYPELIRLNPLSTEEIRAINKSRFE